MSYQNLDIVPLKLPIFFLYFATTIMAHSGHTIIHKKQLVWGERSGFGEETGFALCI